MKRPSFQFYPADWQANSNLRRCSHEEKGIWIDVMCLLHDQDEYGVVRWTLKEVAQAIGTTTKKLKGLVDKGILKGSDKEGGYEPLVFRPRHQRKLGDPVTLIQPDKGPLWYSSRMVIDEYKRQVRASNPDVPKATPDPAPKGGIGATPKVAPDPTPDPAPSRAGDSSTSPSTSPPTGNNLTHLPTENNINPARLESEPEPLPDDWQPRTDTIEYVIENGVPADKLDEWIPEFKIYWKDRKAVRPSWDSQFVSHCKNKVYHYNKKMGQRHANG